MRVNRMRTWPKLMSGQKVEDYLMDLHRALTDESADRLRDFNTIPSTESVTRDTAVSVDNPYSAIDTTAGAIAITLADGRRVGDVKNIEMTVDNGDAVLTVAKHRTTSPEVFTFGEAGDKLLLMWTGSVWVTLENVGVTV
jgi:hypothetical protein